MNMIRLPLLTCLFLVLTFNIRVGQAEPAALDTLLNPYLASHELPAVAAAAVVRGRITAIGAVGVRKAGSNIRVSINDRFHLGSDTKAMTALLAAQMVEAGKLRWDTTIAEAFPELAAKMNAEVGKVTLEQLLSHTSGMPSDNEHFGDLLRQSFDQPGNLDELRLWLVEKWCALPLEAPRGSRFAYSNMGYTIAGAMIERAGGKTWDEMITERLFVPLGLKTAGLGNQANLGRIDAPLGHSIEGGKTEYYLAGPNADNPLIIGPAGIAHMSVSDFARWAGWNAGNGKRPPSLVKPESLTRLHTPVTSMPPKKDAPPGTPPGGKYALGWGELEVDWAPYPLLYHGGSNGKNLAHVWIDKNKDIAIVVVTNIGGKKADEALRKIAEQLYRNTTRKK